MAGTGGKKRRRGLRAPRRLERAIRSGRFCGSNAARPRAARAAESTGDTSAMFVAVRGRYGDRHGCPTRGDERQAMGQPALYEGMTVRRTTAPPSNGGTTGAARGSVGERPLPERRTSQGTATRHPRRTARALEIGAIRDARTQGCPRPRPGDAAGCADSSSWQGPLSQRPPALDRVNEAEVRSKRAV